ALGSSCTGPQMMRSLSIPSCSLFLRSCSGELTTEALVFRNALSPNWNDHLPLPALTSLGLLGRCTCIRPVKGPRGLDCWISRTFGPTVTVAATREQRKRLPSYPQ